MSVDPAGSGGQARLGLGRVHRAAPDPRRGVPVVLAGDVPLLILAAETAGADGLSELEAISGNYPVLILAPARAAAILRAPMSANAAAVAVTLPDHIRKVEVYQSLADPLATQPAVRDVLRAVAAPSHSDAAISLAKIGRLLPAILGGPLPNGAAPSIAGHGIIEVAAADVLAYAENEVAGLKQIVSA